MRSFSFVAAAAAVSIIGLSNGSPALADGTLLPDSRTLTGTMTLANVPHDVSITVDVVNYGNGTAHKAYIIKQFQGGSATSVIPAGPPLTGVNITGCQFVNGGSNGFKIDYSASSTARINGTTAVAGTAPKVVCDAKKGNGAQPPENLDTFMLQ